MELCWNHEQPLWVPMINTAAQMTISPEINDRPLLMNGKDDFGLEWALDPDHPELMIHVKPGCEMLDDISAREDFIHFPGCKDKNREAAAVRTRAMWAKKNALQGCFVGNISAFERIWALNPSFDTMGGDESLVMYGLIRNKAQDFWKIVDSCHFFTFLFPLLAVPRTSSW